MHPEDRSRQSRQSNQEFPAHRLLRSRPYRLCLLCHPTRPLPRPDPACLAGPEFLERPVCLAGPEFLERRVCLVGPVCPVCLAGPECRVCLAGPVCPVCLAGPECPDRPSRLVLRWFRSRPLRRGFREFLARLGRLGFLGCPEGPSRRKRLVRLLRPSHLVSR